MVEMWRRPYLPRRSKWGAVKASRWTPVGGRQPSAARAPQLTCCRRWLNGAQQLAPILKSLITPWMMTVAPSIFSFKPNLNHGNKHKHGWCVLVVRGRTVPSALQKNVKSVYLISGGTRGWHGSKKELPRMKHDFCRRALSQLYLQPNQSLPR